MIEYAEFLASKALRDPSTGLTEIPALNPALFSWQADIVRWALRRGRAAIFADCGLGKTFMQLEWARCVPGRVLILAPLAVGKQTAREAAKFGIDARYVRNPSEHDGKILVTNYEILDHFDPGEFTGIVLDESSILKSYDGATRTAIIDAFRETPYRLACTATPAPNDHMELGNHAEFLGAMTRTEMLAMFFVHDGGDTSKWRIKRHGVDEFWKWVSSWAVMMRLPSDLGYTDEGFVLPALDIEERVVTSPPMPGMLFASEAATLQERIVARRVSVPDRVAECIAEVNRDAGEQWVVWCHLNAESAGLASGIHGAVEIRGSMSRDEKEDAIAAFSDGRARVVVTKPSIAGFGLNWQHCARVAFVGLSDSWESYYQAVRRCWRFGQTRPVKVIIVSSEAEGAVVANIKRKEADASTMARRMCDHMAAFTKQEIAGMKRDRMDDRTDMAEGEGWRIHLGDCVDVARAMPDDSIHYSVFSPPFASLYSYTNSDRDMGNSKDDDEFERHFGFLVSELYRVLMPGRLVSFHCMNIPAMKVRDGFIGVKDFRGDLIRFFQRAGFIFHSEVCIWKDPVTQMQRTKSLGLLHKQIKKDSCMSRQGIPDYVVTMRKPGDNPERVTHTGETFPVAVWQQYASPVWMDINPSDTLQYRSARDHDDERHICPLQLEVIRRCVRLWTNEGDLVFSPFAGIGSEGYVALEMGRRFVGAELKRSYWEQACRNLANVKRQLSLLSGIDTSPEQTGTA